MSYPLDGKDGTPILLMDWKDMSWLQRFDFIFILATLCAPILGVLLAIVATWLNKLGLI
jgi:hypothetical protein